MVNSLQIMICRTVELSERARCSQDGYGHCVILRLIDRVRQGQDLGGGGGERERGGGEEEKRKREKEGENEKENRQRERWWEWLFREQYSGDVQH